MATPTLLLDDVDPQEVLGCDRPLLRLVRHGQSTWNVQGTIQGQCDEARLTPQGRAQAVAVALRVCRRHVNRILSSDLRRAAETAEVIARATGAPITTDRRLRERALGGLEGRAVGCATPAITGVTGERVTDPDAHPDGGESLRALYRRAEAFLTDLAPLTADTVVVAHGGTVRMLHAVLTGTPVDAMSWPPLGNASVTDLVVGEHLIPLTPATLTGGAP